MVVCETFHKWTGGIRVFFVVGLALAVFLFGYPDRMVFLCATDRGTGGGVRSHLIGDATALLRFRIVEWIRRVVASDCRASGRIGVIIDGETATAFGLWVVVGVRGRCAFDHWAS